jgi:hypothetical protein
MAEIFGMDEIIQENTSVDDLATENINLIFVAIDCSGSMDQFTNQMKNELSSFKKALINSKEADEILVSRGDFSDYVKILGYKKTDELDEDFQATGSTRLYDAIVEGTDKLLKYMDYLKSQGMRTKAVFSVFSDGEDNASKMKINDAKKAIDTLNVKEIVTAWISFGPDSINIAKSLNMKNILEVGKPESELRKAFNCLSKSVISNSKSVINKTADFFNV